METTRKISIGSINGVRKGFKGIVARVRMARIAGIARVAKVEENDAGTYTKFVGEFHAWNKDGEAVVAPVAYFPDAAQVLLSAALESDAGSGVEFAFDFFAVPKTGGTGYDWEVVPLIETRKSDPLGALLQQVQAPLPPLNPAPEPQPGAAGEGGDAPESSDNTPVAEGDKAETTAPETAPAKATRRKK